jgi:hypothetical protein
LAQFLLHFAIWKYQCDTDEPVSKEMGEMDEDHPIGLEMSRAIVCSWTVGFDDPH